MSMTFSLIDLNFLQWKKFFNEVILSVTDSFVTRFLLLIIIATTALKNKRATPNLY